MFSEKCKTCKHDKKERLDSQYEYKYPEHRISKELLDKFNEFTDEEKDRVVEYWNRKMAPYLDKLANKINNLTDEEFKELCKGVKDRSYDDSKN